MLVGNRACHHSPVIGFLSTGTHAAGDIDPFHLRNDHPTLSLFEVGQVVRFSERGKVLLHAHSHRIDVVGHAFNRRPVPAERSRVDGQRLDDLEMIPDD